jgi:dual specificity phosphatase 12
MNNLSLIIITIIILLFYIQEKDNRYKLDYIIDNIYLGNWEDSIDIDKIRYNRIECILTLNKRYVHPPGMMKSRGLCYKYISIEDSEDENILPYITESLDFIDRCNGNILIHCTAGVSRSVSIVIAYLIKVYGMSYDQAYDYVENIRPIIQPNVSFEAQLRSI